HGSRKAIQQLRGSLRMRCGAVADVAGSAEYDRCWRRGSDCRFHTVAGFAAGMVADFGVDLVLARSAVGMGGVGGADGGHLPVRAGAITPVEGVIPWAGP